jgi:hypothetical protein
VHELRDVPAPRIFAPWNDQRLLDLKRYPEPLIAVPSG